MILGFLNDAYQDFHVVSKLNSYTRRTVGLQARLWVIDVSNSSKG